MKKTTIIIATTLVVAVGSFLVWRNYNQNISDCCKTSCDKSCEKKSGSYNTKMSLVCEYSCAAKNVDESIVVSQSKSKVGDYTKCPVSGVVFLITDKSNKINVRDKTAFTCCTTCTEIFNKSPVDYKANIN